MKKLILPCSLLLSLTTKGQSGVELNPVSVTSSRFLQRSNETGRNISVIGGDLFAKMPVQSLDELLRYVPGIEVQARGPMGAQSDIVMRGGTYQQVLVLLDGVKVNDPITGHFNSYIPVTPSEIDRIEVLRGPAAAIYGAEAVGGVINVITKTFNSTYANPGLHGNVRATAGQYKFWNSDAGIEYRQGRYRASLGILNNNTSGQLLRGNNRGYIHNNTVSGSVAVNLPREWTLALRGSYDNRDFAAQNFYTTFASDTATETVASLRGQLQLRQQKEKYSHQLDAVYKTTSDHYLYNEASTANENHSRYTQIQYLYSRKLEKGFALTSGTQGSLRSIHSNDRGDHQTGQIAGFGTLLYQRNNWHSSASLRGDYDGNYGFALLPQLSTSYQYHKLTLRATAGRSTRSADFTERFNNYNKTLVKSGSIGNPDLDAETSWSYEAGIDYAPIRYLRFSGTAFYRDQSNVIDWVNTPFSEMPRQVNLDPAGVYALAKNLKEVQTKGVELEASFRKQISPKQHLNVNAGLTLLQSVSNDPNPSFYIIAHAKMLIQSSIVYSIGKLSLSANMIYKERKPQVAKGINAEISSSYAVFNARAAFAFDKKVSAHISCNNIGDIQYSDLLGSKMPSRWLMAGASFSF